MIPRHQPESSEGWSGEEEIDQERDILDAGAVRGTLNPDLLRGKTEENPRWFLDSGPAELNRLHAF